MIPAYNAQGTLAEALDSVFAQDYEPFEVIVIDDGSTDGTADVVRAEARARYLRQENRGPSAARNAGVRATSGEMLAFHDADDVMPSDKLRIQVGFLLEHPEVACVLGRQEVIGDSAPAAALLQRDVVAGDLAGVPLMSMVVRRDVFLSVGGFDERLTHAEDRDLLVRMRGAGIGIEFLPDIVLRRRFDGGNLTFRPPEQHPVFGSLKAKLDDARKSQPEP